MKVKFLQMRKALRVALLVLLLCAIGMGESLAQNIVFADDNVKAICVANWDTNDDGELSYAEAAAVTDLGEVFSYNEDISTFDELQYFTSLTSIGEFAFYGCSGLTSIEIPNSVTFIGGEAFYNCTNLTSIEIPNSVTSIEYGMFCGCNSLTSIEIPNSVTSIGEYAFQHCTNLTSIEIPNSVSSIGRDAFSFCSSLEQIIVAPGNVHYDSRNNCNAIIETESNTLVVGCKNTVIPDAVTSIGDNAFDGCTCLTSIDIPDAVTSIGDNAFGNCTSLTSIDIPDAVTSIGDFAFVNCGNLTSIVFPNSLTSIGDNAFNDCTSLTSIEIPNSVSSITGNAFSLCSSLEQIIVAPGNVHYDSRNNCNAIIETESNTLVVGCKNTVIPDAVTSIGDNAFNGCTCLTSIDIPDAVTSIGVTAFSGCTNLTTIAIPNSVTSIGGYAFSDCTSLTSIKIPNSVTSIEYGMFYGCNSLTSIEIPNSVTSIGEYAFSWCTSLTSIEIPNSVTSIGWDAFSNCSGLTSIEIPNSVTFIGEEAFYDCTSLTSIKIPNSVTSIEYGMFCGCNSLTSIEIPDAVTSIGDDAFNGCTNLTSIKVYALTPPVLGNEAFDYSYCPIYVPYESLAAYLTDWSQYEDRIYPFLQKNVAGYGESTNGKWAFIASPLTDNTAATAIENMTADDYDLYSFDQSEELEWRNYKVEGFMVENGKGYLYASKNGANIIFKGAFNEGSSMNVDLAYEAGKDFAGWNLVGNPFPYAATVSRSYYVMNSEGTGIEPTALSSGTSIEACTGIMVKAETTGETVTFAKPTRTTVENNGLLHIALANEDKVIVSFNAGDELSKYYFGEQNANIYIPKNGKEYAIACSDKQGEMPLNFKAAKNGEYTLAFNPENVEMDYLHLIDNLTGNDVDLLANPSYGFSAKTTDYASRFRLVFATGSSVEGDNFAFINGNGEIVFTDTEALGATLQIVDVLGRVIVNTDAARHVSTAGMTPAVYVLRLINGENVKTQKIVVR